ncbi:formate dehydrogenase, alpha subunit, partial [mine drainage metagenome]
NVQLPKAIGLKSTEMIQAALDRKIRAMYISGENSVRTHPNSNEAMSALRDLDFLVVQDIFMTETAEFADIVLPAASSLENDGTFTNTERRVQLVRKIAEPPGEAKPDWLIYTELSRKLGLDMGFKSVPDIDDERASLVPSWAGISLNRLQNSSLQWPVTSKESMGTEILHVNGVMRGKARFRPLSWADVPISDYPYALITGRYREQYHTATMTSRSHVIQELSPGPYVEMNPQDMVKEGMLEDELINISSSNGSIRARVKSNENLHSGVMFTTFHFSNLPANILTTSELDPLTKTPAYKDTRVRISKDTNAVYV